MNKSNHKKDMLHYVVFGTMEIKYKMFPTYVCRKNHQPSFIANFMQLAHSKLKLW